MIIQKEAQVNGNAIQILSFSLRDTCISVFWLRGENWTTDQFCADLPLRVVEITSRAERGESKGVLRCIEWSLQCITEACKMSGSTKFFPFVVDHAKGFCGNVGRLTKILQNP